MNIRKIFNIPTKEQKQIIDSEVVKIQKIADYFDKILIENRNKDLQEREDKFNLDQTTCSVCKSTKIVNKITNELKSSTQYPQFSFQRPTSRNYTISVDVNHCFDCGNEWKKEYWWSSNEKKWATPKTIYTYYDTFKTWAEEGFKFGISDYEDFHAESMYKVFTNVSLKTHRKLFKSIFN